MPKNKGEPKGRAVEDEQSDQVMAMRSHHLSGLGPGTRTNEPNEAEPPRLTMTNGEIERLNQSSSRNSSFAWLIDSGATCHVLSESALGVRWCRGGCCLCFRGLLFVALAYAQSPFCFSHRTRKDRLLVS